MNQPKHIIIFSHGFGVQKDSRGFFIEIADYLPEVESVLFDYNDINPEKNEVTVRTFTEQTKILKNIHDTYRQNYPDAIIDLIGHSQGAVIIALAKLPGIRKIIFLAPPPDLNPVRMINAFKSRSDTEINLSGVSRLARKDGSFTLVPAEYMTEREQINPLKLYQELAETADLTIITAKQDEILGPVNFSPVKAKIINIDADHNFIGQSRQALLDLLKNEINN